jgi:hypothetical protein
MHPTTQGIVAVVGALSRNLEYLQHHEGSFVSIYDHPAVTLKVSCLHYPILGSKLSLISF